MRSRSIVSVIALASVLFAPFANAATGSGAEASSGSSSAAAASSKSTTVSLEIVVPKSAAVGEAVDMTVRALDSAGKVDKSYKGNIYISVLEDPNATVPFVDDGYTFTAADQGEKTFSKGLSFTKAGKMTVSVIDLVAEKIEGQGIVNVAEGGTVSTTSSGTTGSGSAGSADAATLSVTSPTDGMVVNSTTLQVVGTTKRNSRVTFSVNGKAAGEAQSDGSGAFLGTVTGLGEDKSILKVRVLDGKDAVIAESKDIQFSVQKAGPAISGVAVVGGSKVPAGRPFTVEVRSEPGLQSAKATFGADSITLNETGSGVYQGSFTAPKELGDYPIGVDLKSSLGLTSSDPKAGNVTVVEPVQAFRDIRTTVGDGKVTFFFSLVKDVPDLAKFKIRYANGSGAFTNEVVTFAREKIVVTASGNTASGASASGTAASGATASGTSLDYAWYVQGLEPNNYRFQIVGIDKSDKEMNDVVSDELAVDVGANAAGKCVVQTISGLKAARDGDNVVLTWETNPTATSGYNVYKRDASGGYQLLENVKTNRYVVHFSVDRMEYSDFAVKGVCGNNEGTSADYGSVLRVQTGPGHIALFALFAFACGYFIVRRKRAA